MAPEFPVQPDANPDERPDRATDLSLSLSLIRRERQVRDLILDYALGIAILGLIPIPRLFTLKLLLASGLIVKMIWDIGRLWRWRRPCSLCPGPWVSPSISFLPVGPKPQWSNHENPPSPGFVRRGGRWGRRHRRQ